MHFSICDYLLDVVQNSIEANASEIYLDIEESYPVLGITVRDNGKGMSGEELDNVMDPFFTDGVKHKERKVGLGLAFLSQCLEMTGGVFTLQSEEGRGTNLKMLFSLDHLDTPPFGDLPATLLSALTFGDGYDLVIKRAKRGTGQDLNYTISKGAFAEVLGELDSAGSLSLLKDFLYSQEEC